MKIEDGWVDLCFGAYILYLENNHNIFISADYTHFNYFSCILNKYMDIVSYFNIYSKDKRIKDHIMNNIITILKESKSLDDFSHVFCNMNTLKIKDDVTYNFLGGVGYAM